MKELCTMLAGLMLALSAFPASAGTQTVSSLAQIQGAWAAAQCGDSIILAPGATILDFRPNRKLCSASRISIDTTAGTIGGWYGGQGGGVNLKVGKVIPGSTFALGVRFDNMSDLTIDASASDFQGPSTISGSAIAVVNGKNVVIWAPKVRGFMNGVALTKVEGFLVAYGEFSGMGGDGIDYANSTSGRIHHNYVHDGNHVAAKHPDGIQGWSAAGAPQSRDIEIDHNRVGAGLQGVTFFDHPDQGQLGVTNINIHDNVIVGSYPQGIAVTDGVNVTLQDNQVSTIAGSQWQATVNLTNCTNVTRSGNTVTAYLQWKGITDPARPVLVVAP